MKNHRYLLVLLPLLYGIRTEAQTDTVDYFSLSFEELVNVKIVSASKKYEDLFDAPLSASVLTRDEIQRSGVTSITEALRLIPGIIVRQLTNGNYDIHIRGLDNVPPNTRKFSSISTTTLVMINNRPVYNYMQGGIFWETLPVDLNDIQRIEVVRGPSSTLYGPNAVSGVINIITETIEKKGPTANANVQYGSMNTTIANGSVGYRFSKKFSALISANHQQREREPWYFDSFKQQWYNTPDSLMLPASTTSYFPHPERSMRKFGANAFLQYNPVDKVQLNFSSGLQDSEVQTSNFDIVSNINTFASRTHYFDLRGTTFGLETQLSHNRGFQWPIVGYPGGSFNFSATDATIAYEVKYKKLSLKPEFAYRSAMYDDTELWDTANKQGILNARRYMESYAGTMRSEYYLWNERVRLTGGLRFDKFNHQDKWFTSWQAASSIKINKQNLIRIVYSKAFRSPFIYDTYQDIRAPFPLGTVPEMFMMMHISGNRNLDLLTSNMFEVGYRSRITARFSLDIEAYTIRTENYSAMVGGSTEDTPENFPIINETQFQIQNIPLWVRQNGITVSLSYTSRKFHIKPFVTFQQTFVHDYSMWLNTSDATPNPNNMDPLNNNINSGKGTKIDSKFTPSVYGGFSANYQFRDFNFNVNAYHMSRQKYYDADNLLFPDGRGIAHISAKSIFNARIAWSPAKYLTLFVNARNFLNKEAPEHYKSDNTPRMFLCGLNFKL